MPTVKWKMIKMIEHGTLETEEIVGNETTPFTIHIQYEDTYAVSTLVVTNLGLCFKNVVISCWASNNVQKEEMEMHQFTPYNGEFK